MKLPPDSRELVALFITRGVRFLIIGGWAVVWHGHPRTTGDLDLWVDPSAENAAKVAAAIQEFLPGAVNWSAQDFTISGNCFQLGRIPQRIDILTFADGLDFAQAWSRCATTELDGLTVHFLSREDLLTNKRAVGRLRDLDDLERLEKRPPDEAG